MSMFVNKYIYRGEEMKITKIINVIFASLVLLLSTATYAEMNEAQAKNRILKVR